MALFGKSVVHMAGLAFVELRGLIRAGHAAHPACRRLGADGGESSESDRVSGSSVHARVSRNSTQRTAGSVCRLLFWGTATASGLLLGCKADADCAAVCQPSGRFPPISLASGESLAVLDRYGSDSGRIVIEYISAQDFLDLDRMCDEVKNVWESVREELTQEEVNKVSFGMTNTRKKYVGMRWFVIPVYTCCTSTYLTVELKDDGEWQFRNCP